MMKPMGTMQESDIATILSWFTVSENSCPGYGTRIGTRSGSVRGSILDGPFEVIPLTIPGQAEPPVPVPGAVSEQEADCWVSPEAVQICRRAVLLAGRWCRLDKYPRCA